MINHARTLLLNRSGNSRLPIGTFGEEFVEPSFGKIATSPVIDILRSVLFGSNPDDYTLNYRLAQYTNLLHASDFGARYVLSLDPRFTYRAFSGVYAEQVTGVLERNSGTGTIELIKPYVGDDASGNNYQLWTLNANYLGGAFGLSCNRSDRPETVSLASVPQHTGTGTFWSDPVSLGSSGVIIRIFDPGTTTISTTRYVLQLCDTPSRSLATILNQLLDVGGAVDELCAGRGEPYTTFLNLFRDAPCMNERVVGVLLAVIYGTEALRAGNQ